MSSDADELKKYQALLNSGLINQADFDKLTADLSVAVQGQQNVTAVGHSLAVGGDIQGDVYFGQPTEDPAEALRIYRRVLFQTGGRMPLRGLNIEAGDAGNRRDSIGLAHVYIDLNTTSRVAGSERGEKEQPVSALAAVIANRQVVLVGDPGGGKSTFINYLALSLAGVQADPAGHWLDSLPGWPKAEATTVPVPVVLRDFAGSLSRPLPAEAQACHLADFIETWLSQRRLEFVQKPLAQALEQGQALLLLDGLDELSTVAERLFVRDAVAAFLDRYPASRAVITCRTLSYQPPQEDDEPDFRIRPAEIPVFELSPFDEARIDRFITGWYAELTRLGQVRLADQADLTARLKQAVRRPDMWLLAPNPLLLTVMALVHTHKGRLPEARALLYEETIEVLLWRWEQVKRERTLTDLLAEAGRRELDLKLLLARLAYEGHEQLTLSEWAEKTADIGELTLQKALLKLKPGDHNWVYEVLETIKMRAGLLVERSPGVFTFPHRTFQEYLAGVYLAGQPNFARLARDKLAGEGNKWREVILLAVGRLVYKQEDTAKPLTLVAELCPRATSATDAAWRKAWLAGEALLEMGLHRVTDQALGQEMLERVRARLADLLAAGGLAPRERAEAGDVLARLGDERPGVTAGSMVWCHIPAGKFLMGSDKGDERPQHSVELPAYYLSRYPVTNAQYGAFVAAGGYGLARYWGAAMANKYWSEAGFKGRYDDEARQGPVEFGEPFNLPNHPVVGVSWYEAVAYCHWLTEQLGDLRLLKYDLATETVQDWALPAGEWVIRLPTEAEWEKAARGGDGREYPWGGKIEANRLNYDQTGIGTSSAVGCFPGGRSPYGCEEMSGNVFEWCSTVFGDYPFKVRNEWPDEYLKESGSRVLRGGAFIHLVGRCRCASRIHFDPNLGSGNYGFRVMLSPL